MWFEVSSKIAVHDPTPDMISWCKDNLVLSNPEFEKKKRMGLWTGNVPRSFNLYERVGSDILLPFGLIREIYQRYYQDYPFRSLISFSGQVYYNSNIKPYDYQEKAIQGTLEGRNGILVMPCGAGKTNCGIEIIARLGVPALWLTHTQDLLNQSMNRAKSLLGINLSTYGTITGGKINIGSGITFATVQTMSKIDLSQYKDMWGCIVVDECHKAVGTPTKAMMFYKVLSQLSCRYKFGLTATPKRADGMEKAMFALIGDILYEVPRSEVESTICPVHVETISTGYSPNTEIALCSDGTINYAGLVEDMTHSQTRFQCVSNAINALDGSALVLGNRVEYLQRLNEEFIGRSVCLSSMGTSMRAKEERKEALRKLNSGELDAVFATYQLAKEGLDVPSLRYVVLATPEKDETTVTQAAGRVARKSQGKEFGTVIDFLDNFGMLKGWHKKRQNIFVKKLNFILT